MTNNVRDFTWDDNVSPYDVLTPDQFLVMVDENWPSDVREAARQQVHYWGRRSDREVDLPQRLRTADCPDFAERVRHHLQMIARSS